MDPDEPRGLGMDNIHGQPLTGEAFQRDSKSDRNIKLDTGTVHTQFTAKWDETKDLQLCI
jgi:hypothetical protein